MWKQTSQTDQDLIDKLNSGYLTLTIDNWSGKDASFRATGSMGQGIIYFGSNTWNIAASPAYESMMTFQRIGDHTIRYFNYPSLFQQKPYDYTDSGDPWEDYRYRVWAQGIVRGYMTPHTMDFYMPNDDILNLMRSVTTQYGHEY